MLQSHRLSYSIFGSTEFALTWIEVMIFRALLLIERVTLINIEAFSNPNCKPGRTKNAISDSALNVVFTLY